MRSLARVLACCCIVGTAAQGADESSTAGPSLERSSAVVEQSSEQEADFGDRWKAFHLPTILEWVASMPYPALHCDCATLQFQQQQSEMVAAICEEDNPQRGGLCFIAGHQYLEGNITSEQFDRADRHIFLSATTRVVLRQ